MTRRKQTYRLLDQLPAPLDDRGRPEYLSTHLTLTGAFRALKRYANWTTHGWKFQNALTVAYITTDKSGETITGDIDHLTKLVSHTQHHRIIIYQLPLLAAYVPRGQLLPQDRSPADRAVHRRAVTEATKRENERYALRDMQSVHWVESTERPAQEVLGDQPATEPNRPKPDKRPPRERLAFTILPYVHPSEQPADSTGRRVSTHKALPAAYEALIRYRREQGSRPPAAQTESCLVTTREQTWVQAQLDALALGTKRARQHKTPIEVYCSERDQQPPYQHLAPTLGLCKLAESKSGPTADQQLEDYVPQTPYRTFE